MSDASDNLKGPIDAGELTPQRDVKARTRSRGSKSRRMSSSTSSPMRDILDHERDTATAKRAKFFSGQAVTDNSTGTLAYPPFPGGHVGASPEAPRNMHFQEAY
jgi:hypothetical protein